MDSPTYAGRKVLVTGADGFIGSHLTQRLEALGANVRAFVYYNSWSSIGWLAQLPNEVLSNVEIVTGDIRDTERVEMAVKGVEQVFHLSSLIGIPYSYVAARSYVETNVIGALNVLEACRKSTNLEMLVHTSTSEVYGSARTVPITEDHPLTGQSPYSATKIAADKLAESYHLSHEVPIATARPFNTFGPRQTPRAIIPTIASQLLSGAPELHLGAVEPTRDFTYVGDTVEGLLAIGQCEASIGQVLNIGTGSEWTIRETAEKLMLITGVVVPIISDPKRTRPDASEVDRLCADATRLRELTGWAPKTDFETGLSKTVAWMRTGVEFNKATGFAI